MAITRASIDTDPKYPLSNPQQEKFAQARASGLTFRASAGKAGYSDKISNAGARLGGTPHVAARIAHLVVENKAKTEAKREVREAARKDSFRSEDISLEYLITETQTNLEMARDGGDIKEANNCIKILAALCGIVTGKNPPADQNKSSRLNDDAKDRLGQQINIQVLNQVTERMDDSVGDESKALETHSSEGEGDSDTVVSDGRNVVSVSRSSRLALTNIDPIPLITPIPRD